MAKYHALIFETILLNYTGPSVDKPLLFSFVFLFGGGELFKMSKMIFVFLWTKGAEVSLQITKHELHKLLEFKFAFVASRWNEKKITTN